MASSGSHDSACNKQSMLPNLSIFADKDDTNTVMFTGGYLKEQYESNPRGLYLSIINLLGQRDSANENLAKKEEQITAGLRENRSYELPIKSQTTKLNHNHEIDVTPTAEDGDSHRSQIAALQEERDNMKLREASASDERDKYRAQVTALMEEGDKQNVRETSSIEDRDKYRSQVAALVEERDKKDAQCASLIAERDQLLAEMANQRLQVTTMMEEKDSQRILTASLTEKVDEYRHRIASLTEKKDELEVLVESLLQEKEQQTNALMTVKEKKGQLADELPFINDKVKDLTEEEKRLRVERDQLRKDIAIEKAIASALETERDWLREERDQLRDDEASDIEMETASLEEADKRFEEMPQPSEEPLDAPRHTRTRNRIFSTSARRNSSLKVSILSDGVEPAFEVWVLGIETAFMNDDRFQTDRQRRAYIFRNTTGEARKLLARPDERRCHQRWRTPQDMVDHLQARFDPEGEKWVLSP